MSDDFEHRTIDAGAVRLHIAEAKPASGVTDATPLVVFLHGFPEFWWSWRKQLRALADAGIWAVAPDLRGYGQSDKPWDVKSYEIEDLAGDVAGVIRALGRKTATVVGHDWGAAVAWEFAQGHHGMLERLAIMNGPHPLSMMRELRRPGQMAKSWYMFFFQLPKVPELVVAKDDYAFIRRTFAIDGVPPEDIERYVAALRTPGVVRSGINYYRAALRRLARGRVPKARVVERPVLVLWGDRDRYLGRPLADPPKRFVPNARVEHFPNASHWLPLDEPERVSERLIAFVRE